MKRYSREVLSTLFLSLASFFSIPAAGSITIDLSPDPGFDVLSYRFDLELTDDDDVIHGTTYVELVAERDIVEIALDLIGSQVENVAGTGVAGMNVHAVAAAPSEPGVTLDRRTLGYEMFTELEFEHFSNLLSIRLPLPLEAGEERVLRIEYSGIPGDGLIIGRNRFGDRTFFSDNYPDRARYYLPTVDHPGDKALCSYSVTAPVQYQVIACGDKIEETDLADGRRRTVWQSSVPIPTKVMTIGVARFAVESLGTVEGIPIETWVYPQDREKGFLDFAPTPEILRFFHRNFGPYPYRKMASVQSTTRYGGMENAGNVFYGEGVVTGLGENESLIAHELAHQWFGDSVSERDWRHVWLSEGFATYGAALYLEHRYGSSRLSEVMLEARRTIARFAVTQPEGRVVRSEAVDVARLLNPNVYQKGAWTLHMLRRQIGDDAFWRSLRTFYARYRDRNATTDDFRQIAEVISGQELGGFFEQWLERAGHPRIRGSFRTGESASSRVVVELEQSALSEAATLDEPYDLLLDLGLLGEDGQPLGVVTVHLSDRRERFELDSPGGDTRVARIVLDPAVWALIDGTELDADLGDADLGDADSGNEAVGMEGEAEPLSEDEDGDQGAGD